MSDSAQVGSQEAEGFLASGKTLARQVQGAGPGGWALAPPEPCPLPLGLTHWQEPCRMPGRTRKARPWSVAAASQFSSLLSTQDQPEKARCARNQLCGGPRPNKPPGHSPHQGVPPPRLPWSLQEERRGSAREPPGSVGPSPGCLGLEGPHPEGRTLCKEDPQSKDTWAITAPRQLGPRSKRGTKEGLSPLSTLTSGPQCPPALPPVTSDSPVSQLCPCFRCPPGPLLGRLRPGLCDLTPLLYLCPQNQQIK